MVKSLCGTIVYDFPVFLLWSRLLFKCLKSLHITIMHQVLLNEIVHALRGLWETHDALKLSFEDIMFEAFNVEGKGVTRAATVTIEVDEYFIGL
jgi:hypothetical protein